MVAQKINIYSISCFVLATSIALFRFYSYDPALVPKSMPETESQYETDEDDEDDAIDDPSDEKDQDTVVFKQDEQNDLDFKDANQLRITKLPDGMQECRLIMQNGDSLASVLNNLGASVKDVYDISCAITQVCKPKQLKPGLELIVTLSSDSKTIQKLEFTPNYEYRFVVTKRNKGFHAEKIALPVKKITKNISGNLNPKSPYNSLKSYGMNNALASDMIRAINHIANLKSAKTPVSFELLYEDFYRDDGEGNLVKPAAKPKLLYVSVVINGKVSRIYKFSDKNCTEYIDSTGLIIGSNKNAAMFIQPMVYRKITSRFGPRIHPTSGRMKRHTGVDLAAAHGTPVKAAASGTVSKASYYSGYGKYIKINHSNALSTAYGHLSRIVVTAGQYVRQGQIIGYCGSTGRATGSHLHYEVMKNGQFMNPLSYVPRQPEKLSGKRLANFNAFKKAVNLHIGRAAGARTQES